MVRVFLLAVVLVLALAEGKPHKPKKVRCKDNKFPACFNKDLYCPNDCLHTCVVDCRPCQPVCTPPPPPPPPPPPKPLRVKCQDRKTCKKDLYCPAACPRTCTVNCTTCQPICRPPPPLPSSSPPPPPNNTPSWPPIPDHGPSPPPVTNPSPPPDSSEVAGGMRVRCKNSSYPSCYYREHQCPAACSDRCEVDCVTCSPWTDCNRPGAVCQDPRFIGADGIAFYFHGRKGSDFWVQSLGIIFDKHQILVGAKKTATWDNAIDRIELSYDGQPIFLAEEEGAKWKPDSTPSITITRSQDTNTAVIKVEGNFEIIAAVVPITEKDSRIHKYGITDEDCFAHLDLGFKFYSLSDDVNGVLGQTYASNYVSRVKMGVDMPVLGGQKEFTSSSIFSTDCAVARFKGTQLSSANNFQHANLNCASGIDGSGVVCKR